MKRRKKRLNFFYCRIIYGTALYQRTADQGLVVVQCNLGYMYERAVFEEIDAVAPCLLIIPRASTSYLHVRNIVEIISVHAKGEGGRSIKAKEGNRMGMSKRNRSKRRSEQYSVF